MAFNPEIDLLQKFIANEAVLNSAVSQQTVNWHIHHSLLVIIGIVGQLEASHPKDYTWRFSLPRFYIFSRGSIPRGKGRAPKQVNPEQIITKEELEVLIESARKKSILIENLHKKSHFKHPYFGLLKTKPAIYFTKLHSAHHLKIIDEIISA